MPLCLPGIFLHGALLGGSAMSLTPFAQQRFFTLGKDIMREYLLVGSALLTAGVMLFDRVNPDVVPTILITGLCTFVIGLSLGIAFDRRDDT